jgi:hypothetical protein
MPGHDRYTDPTVPNIGYRRSLALAGFILDDRAFRELNRREQGRAQLNADPLDLIERDIVAPTVIKLRRARAFVCGHCLRVFGRII